MSDDERRVWFGETVYSEDGEELGTIQGVTEHGFLVTTLKGIVGMSAEHLRAGHEFGEAELTWRCLECGEMGDLDDDFPETCPSCGAPREDLYYFTED